jgi:peroxiredoxin
MPRFPALAIVSVVACGNASPTPSASPAPSTATPAPTTPTPIPATPASARASDAAKSDTPAGEGDAKSIDKARAIAALIGVTPPEWHAERWMNSPPLALAKLRGQVVMVRWWTAECPFCSATAPALRTFDQTYGPRGLKVIGMYHHKESTPFDPKVYEDTAKQYKFTFPIAFDPEWRTLGSWMRDAGGREVNTGATSVTFVLDKRGVIRHVHPGGSFVQGEPAYEALRAAVEKLLAEA